MEHLTEALIDNNEEDSIDLQEEILEQFKSGLKRQPWTLIKTYKLKKLYQNWSRGIIYKDLLEDCLWIAIENLQKIIINGQILHYTDEITDDNLDRWNEFIEDEYGHGRYTEQIDRFSNLLVKLTNAKTDEQKMIALDNVLGTAHGIGPVARWFVEGGGKTLDEVSEWKEVEEHLTQSQPKTIEAVEKQIMEEMSTGQFRPTVAQYHYLYEKYPEEADRLGLEDIGAMYVYDSSGGIAGEFAELYGEKKLWEQLKPPAVKKAAKTLIRSWEAQKATEHLA